MNRPPGVVVVGIGGYGRSHLSSISACQEEGLCALNGVVVRPQDAEPEFEATLESHGATVYRDYADMLEKESERSSLIAIPTGIPSHRTLTVAALDSGYHVLCEKPVAGSIADAVAMREARDRAQRVLGIGFQYIFAENVQMLKAARLDGRWGALKKAKGLGLWPRTSAYYDRNEWAGKLVAGGSKVYDSPAQNAVSHYLQLMLYLAGGEANTAARAATLYGENYRAKRIDSADTQFIRVGTDTGVEIEFWCSHSVAEEHEIEIVLTFEHASVEFHRNGPGNRFLVVKDGVREPFGSEESDSRIRERVFSNCIEAIAEGGQPLSTIDNAMGHTEIIETLFEKSAPVVDVGESYIDFLAASNEGEGPAGENRIIRGLDDLAVACFENETSFSEAGAPWATAGREITLR